MVVAITLTVYFGTFAIALVLVRRATGENPFGQA